MAASTIFPTSLAAAKAIGIENIRFAPIAETLPRKILIIGKYDRDLTDEIEKWVPRRISSPEEAGGLYGFGTEIYRLAKWVFSGSNGVETWVSPDPDWVYLDTTPDEAWGSISVTATGVLAGTLHLYIAGEYVPVAVNNDDTGEDIENAIVAAINADKTLPVIGSTTIPSSGQANTRSRNRSTYGNYTKITFNEDYGQEFPIGVSVVVVQPTGGTGPLLIEKTLEKLGLNDEQNENYFTDLVHSDANLTTALDEISDWNGVGNLFVGNYGQLIQRPLRCLVGDTTAGSTGFNDLISLGDSRKLDRTNGVIAVPGSPNHPSEIAALALGIAARINNQNAAEGFSDEILPGIWPGAPDDRWTSSYNSRDLAVKAGISPTVKGKGGTVKLQNLVTFYHPDNVPQDSNGYRSMRAISVLQNISNSVRETFALEKWQRISIVENVENVTSLTARQKVKDKRAVEAEIVALAEAWEANSWIYSASFTINRIKTGNYVEIRPGGTGFNVTIPVILSGEMWILDSLIQFDTALTVFTQ